MTVRELIELLSEHHPDDLVAMEGPPGELDLPESDDAPLVAPVLVRHAYGGVGRTVLVLEPEGERL